MYFPKDHKDKTGALITQLKVILDDLKHLKAVGKKTNLSDYPHLEETINLALLGPSGDWNYENLERVEKAGFMIARYKDDFYIYTRNGALKVLVNPRHHTQGKANASAEWFNQL